MVFVASFLPCVKKAAAVDFTKAIELFHFVYSCIIMLFAFDICQLHNGAFETRTEVHVCFQLGICVKFLLSKLDVK